MRFIYIYMSMANSGPSKTNNNAARPPRFCGANFLEKLDLKCKDVYKNLPANSVLKRPDSRAALVFCFYIGRATVVLYGWP